MRSKASQVTVWIQGSCFPVRLSRLTIVKLNRSTPWDATRQRRVYIHPREQTYKSSLEIQRTYTKLRLYPQKKCDLVNSLHINRCCPDEVRGTFSELKQHPWAHCSLCHLLPVLSLHWVTQNKYYNTFSVKPCRVPKAKLNTPPVIPDIKFYILLYHLLNHCHIK